MTALITALLLGPLGSPPLAPMAGPAWASPESGPQQGRRADRGGRRGSGFERIQHLEEELLGRVRANSTQQHKRLLELKTSQPRLYRRALTQLHRAVQRRHKDARSLPRFFEMADIHMQMMDLATSYANLPPSEQTAARRDLDALASQLFELRQEERRVRLAEVEERLERLRSELTDRDEDKERIVDEYVDDYLLRPRF